MMHLYHYNVCSVVDMIIPASLHPNFDLSNYEGIVQHEKTDGS